MKNPLRLLWGKVKPALQQYENGVPDSTASGQVTAESLSLLTPCRAQLQASSIYIGTSKLAPPWHLSV